VLAICVYFERRSGCGRDYDFEKWRHLTRSFAVDHVYVINHVQIPCFQPDLDSFTLVDSFEEINWSGRTVFVEKDIPPNRTAVPYFEFDHLDDEMLCFGANAKGMVQARPKVDTELDGDWITIPTASKYGLWDIQAATIILADRYHRDNL